MLAKSEIKEMKMKGDLTPNKYYKDDFSYDIELNRFLLRIIGLWPATSRRSKLLSKFSIAISVIFLLPFFLSQSSYVFFIEKDSALRLQEFGPLSFVTMAIIRYVIMLWKLDRFAACIDVIANDWRQADDNICRPIMLRYARASRLFTKLNAFVMYGGVGFYTWALPFVKDQVKGHNSTTRPLPYPVEFFVFDTQTSPMYEIVYVGYSISMLGIVCTTTCGICTIAVKLVMHACSQFEIVVAFVDSFDDDKLDRESNDNADTMAKNIHDTWRITEIIRRHLYALAFVDIIEEILNEICLIDVVGGTLNICIVGYYLLTECNNSAAVGLITYVMLWLTMVSSVFVFCCIGEHLSAQCEQVGIAIYMTDWWKMRKDHMKAMILVIASSQIPVKFTAGKMATLSLFTFGSVMKASMAYLNALRTVM